eukprot:scaffold15650_cov58-Phaeocystis_antarctica.AAC.4
MPIIVGVRKERAFAYESVRLPIKHDGDCNVELVGGGILPATRRCVPGLHARRLTRFSRDSASQGRAIRDVADSAVRSGGPWLAQHAICIRTRRRVGRGCIGTAPQIGAVIVRAPVSRYEGKQGQRGSRSLAIITLLRTLSGPCFC